MKKRLLLLANKVWQEKQLFFQKVNHLLRNLKPIKNYHQRRMISFLAYAITVLIVSTLTALYKGKADVNVYNARSGALVTTLSPGSEVYSETGWVDIPYGLRAYQRSNGEYVVFVEEDAKAKIIMCRVKL